MVARQQVPYVWFFALAGLLLTVCTGIVRSALLDRNPALIAFCVTLDLTVTLVG